MAPDGCLRTSRVLVWLHRSASSPGGCRWEVRGLGRPLSPRAVPRGPRTLSSPTIWSSRRSDAGNPRPSPARHQYLPPRPGAASTSTDALQTGLSGTPGPSGPGALGPRDHLRADSPALPAVQILLHSSCFLSSLFYPSLQWLYCSRPREKVSRWSGSGQGRERPVRAGKSPAEPPPRV